MKGKSSHVKGKWSISFPCCKPFRNFSVFANWAFITQLSNDTNRPYTNFTLWYFSHFLEYLNIISIIVIHEVNQSVFALMIFSQIFQSTIPLVNTSRFQPIRIILLQFVIMRCYLVYVSGFYCRRQRFEKLFED